MKRTRTRLDEQPQREPVRTAQKPLRDARGRLLPGNDLARGHGRPRAELRDALREAVTSGDLEAILRAAVGQARRGNLSAARLVLEYALGKPGPLSASIAIEIGQLDSLKSCAQASSAIVSRAAAGTLDLESATRLASLVESARASIEASELEERLRALEVRLAAQEAPEDWT